MLWKGPFWPPPLPQHCPRHAVAARDSWGTGERGWQAEQRIWCWGFSPPPTTYHGLRFLSLKMGVSGRALTTSVGRGCKVGVGPAVAVEGPSGLGGRVSQCP